MRNVLLALLAILVLSEAAFAQPHPPATDIRIVTAQGTCSSACEVVVGQPFSVAFTPSVSPTVIGHQLHLDAVGYSTVGVPTAIFQNIIVNSAGTHRFKIDAYNAAGYGSFTPDFVFTAVDQSAPPPPPPPQPSWTSPCSDNCGVVLGTTVTLLADPGTGAETYHLLVDGQQVLARTVAEAVVNGVVTIPVSGLTLGRHTLALRVQNSAGTATSMSLTVEVVTTGPTPPPAPPAAPINLRIIR